MIANAVIGEGDPGNEAYMLDLVVNNPPSNRVEIPAGLWVATSLVNACSLPAIARRCKERRDRSHLASHPDFWPFLFLLDLFKFLFELLFCGSVVLKPGKIISYQAPKWLVILKTIS